MPITAKKYRYQFHCMTTPCEVLLYCAAQTDANKVSKLIENNTRRLEKKYNFFSDDSLLTALNQRTKQAIEVDDETIQVLTKIKQLSIETKGCFDITTGTLKSCSTLKSSKEIETCREKLRPFIGPNSWTLDGNIIKFANPYVKLDLGGVIKEYAVDQAALIAKKANMSALINFGGDIYVNGRKPDGSAFSIAIKNPKNPDENAAVVQLTDQGLTTSAHYERSTVVDGTNYSHIIGQQTPMSKTILSATVITDSVMSSGVYSTSLMLDPTLDVISKIGVVLIDEQLRLHQNIFNA